MAPTLYLFPSKPEYMRIANVIEGGLTGAATLNLLQETLHKIDHGAPRHLLHKSGVIKQLRKRKAKPSTKLYVKLAGELLSNAAYFGLISLGKKKNAILRGGLLGAAAGLGSAFLQEDKETETSRPIVGQDDNTVLVKKEDSMKKKLLTAVLYTAGGLLAGTAVQKLSRKGKKNKRKSK